MGKHSSPGISYWEARKRRKDLRNRAKPPRRRGPTKKSWFIVILLVGFFAGSALGYYAKPLGKLGARLYLSVKEGQWQQQGQEKQEVEQALSTVSVDPNKTVNTLVMGSDSGSVKGEGGWCRSDVMMLVCLQEREKKAVVISIPRDTKVVIAGHGTEKINAAHAYGGPSAAIDIVKQVLGIDVNHYVSMNFNGFKGIVNAVGGVPIHLSKPINDPHSGYLPPGDLRLDWEQALVVVRSRKLPNGDVDRIQNQQAFLKALMDKLSGMRSVSKAKQLVDIVAANCKMDYDAGELMTLADELRGFSLDNVQFVTLPGVSKYISGASYYVLNDPQVASLVQEVKQTNAVSPETIARLQTEASPASAEQLYAPDSDVVKVLAGVKAGGGAVAIVAQELRLLGHQNVTEGQAKQPTAVSVLYHRKEAKKAAEDIKASIPELAGAQVQFSDEVTGQYNAPVVLVLGTSFATPSLVSIYGRLMQPAINVENLGKHSKSFT